MASITFPTLTGRQAEADALLQSGAKYVLLRGGARSGKTYAIVRRIFARALRQPGSRHIVVRKYAADAIRTAWEQTVVPFVNTYLRDVARVYRSPHSVHLVNDASVLVGGAAPGELDKILGGEYDTIFPNEVSEFTWHAYSNLMHRVNPVAVDGKRLAGRMVADCNPPTKMHWTYKLFAEGINPSTGAPVDNREQFASFKLVPQDNAANLAADYIAGLNALSGAARVRFVDGEWGTAAGTIYDEFDPTVHAPRPAPPPPHDRPAVVAIDFGYIDPTAILWTYRGAGGGVVVYREYKHTYGRTDQHARAFIEASLPDCVGGKHGLTLDKLRALPPREQAAIVDRRYTIVGDHDAQYRAGFEACGIHIQPAQKAILEGIDQVKVRLSQGRHYDGSDYSPPGLVVSSLCSGLVSEFGGYVWDQPRGLEDFRERPKPGDDHLLDALRYAIMEHDRPRGARVR